MKAKRIVVIPAKVYGRKIFYPGCHLSQAICDILKRKTLRYVELAILDKHGYEVVYVDPKTTKE